jgi:cyanophycinase-like exopeptidase
METFFRNHERNPNSGAIEPLISQFAEVFMVGGPQGAQVVQANAFALVVPKRKKLFDDMGWQSTELVSLSETTLNGQYTMVETRWRMTFASQDQSPEEIQADSTFIVYTGGEELKIVMYLSHGDVLATLANRRVRA